MSEESENEESQDVTPAQLHAAVDPSGGGEVIGEPGTTRRDTVPVVGLGGSAGSIAALQTFFELVRPDLGISYVVVIHLAPDQESHLADILRKRTLMDVVQVRETARIKPDTVYVIPPFYHLTMSEGRIELAYPEQERGKRVAVDLFFRSLAASHGTKAVAVVLSGTDGDGAVGIKRIKEAAGVTIVQDPLQADHEGMPTASIDTGMVDWILPIEQIPQKLADWIDNEHRINLPPAVKPEVVSEEDVDEKALREILRFVCTRSGHDFSHYKRATVLRRIMRRLQVNLLTDLPSYVVLLRSHPGEATALLLDMLISVTNFFRDPESYQALEPVLSEMLAGKPAGEPLRVWVPGCATGEEPYSLAMMLVEQAEVLGVHPVIQIFATDLDENALKAARDGYYPLAITADVSPVRLKKFFINDHGRFRVRKEIRDRVIFAPHNLLVDAPFSRLDLVSCRNLLIYFDQDAQERAFNFFHFALLRGGSLFLGGSETAEGSGLFLTRDRKHRIFRREDTASGSVPIFPLGTARTPTPLFREQMPAPASQLGKQRNRAEDARTTLADAHAGFVRDVAPPSVLVNTAFQIIHLSQGAGKFLHFSEGALSMDLFTVIHPKLRGPARSALFRSMRLGEDARTPTVAIEVGGAVLRVVLRVHRPRGSASGGLAENMLIVFDEADPDTPPHFSAPAADEAARQLEEELQQLRTEHAGLNDYLGASIEELRAGNEELQAINEEHRNAVEALETSQEELQATNEELITVNQELKHKLDELSNSNADLRNFISSSDVATIFLSRDLQIKRYTPKVSEIFRIISSDVGRDLADLRHSLASGDFMESAKSVVATLTPLERKVHTTDGKCYLMRMSSYQTEESEGDGVIATFFDITASERAEAALRQSEERYRAIISQMGGGIVHITPDGGIIYANRKFREMLGYTPDRPIGTAAMMLEPSEGAESIFQQLDHEGSLGFEKELVRQNGDAIRVEVSVSPIRDEQGVIRSAVALVIDITDRRRAEGALASLRDRLAYDLEGVTRIHQLSERLLAAEGVETALGDILTLAMDFAGMNRGVIQLKDEESGRMHIVVHRGVGEACVEHFRYAGCGLVANAVSEQKRRIWVEDVAHEPTLNGRDLHVLEEEGIRCLLTTLLIGQDGGILGVLSTYAAEALPPSDEVLRRLDVLAWMAAGFIEKIRANERLRKSETRLAAIFDEAEVGLAEISMDGRFRRVNRTLCRILGRTEDELLATDVAGVTHPSDLPDSLDSLRRLRETGEVVSLDKRYLTPGGAVVWANSTLSLLATDPNQPPMILAVTADLTERRQHEAASREAKEHLQRVMESVKEHSVITIDEKGRITGWNSGAVATFGFSAEEAMGREIDIIFTEEDLRSAVPEKERETAVETGLAADERWHVRKGGELFWVSGVVSPIYNEGVLTGFVKVARDLTGQRLSEAALRNSEERFRTLSDAVPHLVWTNDGQGVADYFNQRWYDYTKLTFDESYGLGWQAVVHPEDKPGSVAAWEHALATGESFYTEYRLLGTEGYRWFIGRNIPVRDGDGAVVSWFGTATDVENLKRAEEALRQSEEMLRIALESAELGAWDWNVTEDRFKWNDRHHYLLGLEPDDSPKTALFFLDFIHPEDRESVSAKLSQAVEAAGAFQAEFRIIRSDDGAVRWISGYGRVMDVKEGRAVRMSGVMYDFTQRKNSEQELREAHDELERRVSERTRELSDALDRLNDEARERKHLEDTRRELLKRLVTSQEEERLRISRELHDNLSQLMVEVQFKLDHLQSDAKGRLGMTFSEGFDELREMLQLLIKAAHRQAWELRPPELDHLGLQTALEHYVEDWSSRTGIEAAFESDSPASIAPEVAIVLYRVVQEALANVLRHANCKRVDVTLDANHPIRVIITDDGSGFDPEKTGGRLGLLGMRERLSAIGGGLEIQSDPTTGTTLIAQVPSTIS